MSDTFHIHCEVCDTKLRVPEESRGLAVKCPHCEHVQHVPTLNEESMSDTAVEDPTSADFAENLSELADDHDVECPNCEEMIPAGQTVCGNCGYNEETGITFNQGAAAYKTPRRKLPMPVFVSVIFGSIGDLIRMLTPRGVHPTITGTGMFMIMALIVCGVGIYMSNTDQGKAKHLSIRIVQELETYLGEKYPGKINADYLRVVDPVNIVFKKTTGVHNRVRFTAELSIVTRGKRGIVGTVEGVFDAGLLFYGLELTQTVLGTEFELYPDFLDQLTHASMY